MSSAHQSRRWKIRPGGPLRGNVRIPGDKSIGHRALLFGALAEGSSVVTGLSGGLDNASTADAMRAMGAQITIEGEAGSREGQRARIEGVGLRGLKAPTGVIDCGNSGTTMRMIAGVLVAQNFGTRLVGDASLTGRPMRRIVDPLRARGAHIAGVRGNKEGEHYPPLSVAPLMPDERLTGLEYHSPIASAQVKSALLLSGLWADGPTAIAEPVLSRDHTERMLSALGVPIEAMGPMVVLDPDGWEPRWDGFEWQVPGDISGAAFPIAAALLVPDSEVVLEDVGVNPTRTGILDALRSMRARIDLTPRGDAAGNEPIAQIAIRHGALGPGRLGGELLTRMIDEVPVFAAICARASGRTDIRDAGELRVKESDRVATTVGLLRAFGVDCTEVDDGLTVQGDPSSKLRAARVQSGGDHRIAMSAAVLALAAEGESVIEDVGCVDTSFPGFAAMLRELGADVVVEEVTGEDAVGG